MCVGRSEDVATAGDQRAEAVGPAGVLLVRRRRRRAARVRQHLPPSRPRAARLRCRDQPPGRSPARTTPGATSSSGELRAAKGFKGREGFDSSAWGLASAAGPRMARPGLRRRLGPGGAIGRRPGRPRGDRRAVRDGAAARRRSPRVRGRRELEDPHRELPRVLPLPGDPPGAVPGEPAVERPQLPGIRAPGSAARWTCARAWTPCPSTAPAAGSRCAGWTPTGLRTVIYLNVFPNILVSLHPDYVMVHRLTPLAPNRTRIECTWAFAPESVAKADFDPSYAVDFWDITNRQDWQACESVQRGLTLRAREARAAVTGGGRGLPVRDDGGARLPGPAGVQPRRDVRRRLTRPHHATGQPVA